MSRPLRKTKPDGTSYHRREAVEAEIRELATLSAAELEHRSTFQPRTVPGFVSPEALVHFVRNLPEGGHRDKLTEQLLDRVVRRVPRAADTGGRTTSLTRMNIREDVVDHFVDLLLSDRDGYDDRLDYYEVNFNSAIAWDRQDASARHWTHENRSDELGSDDAEVSDRVEAAVGGYDPFEGAVRTRRPRSLALLIQPLHGRINPAWHPAAPWSRPTPAACPAPPGAPTIPRSCHPPIARPGKSGTLRP